ncbi:MAG: nucleotidyltransferase family protein [Clostridia bacterium]|nr:nucleotidyltransferase family protein [Clostridia bacterium]
MVAGIVSEYNPFHNGHMYHIEKTRQAGADTVVCVMSGNFVQRGECALIDKTARSEAAIRGGADLVIDLPVPWAMSSAESFARGSISLLSAIGIDLLSFGSENDSKELLYLCAEATEDEKVSLRIKELMSEGLSYPTALYKSTEEIYGTRVSEILRSPNSTLGVEYIKQLKKYSPDCDILPVKRMAVDHDSAETTAGFASASRIRELASDGDVSAFVPDFSLKGEDTLHSIDFAERAILSALRETPKEDYALYVTDTKGLSDRIYNAVRTATSLEELYTAAKSKNYTHSRVRREVMNIYLKVPAEFSLKTPPYIKVLAANRKGLSLLKNARLPVVTKHSDAVFEDAFSKELYALQCSATDKFSLMAEKIAPMGLEQKTPLSIIEK